MIVKTTDIRDRLNNPDDAMTCTTALLRRKRIISLVNRTNNQTTDTRPVKSVACFRTKRGETKYPPTNTQKEKHTDAGGEFVLLNTLVYSYHYTFLAELIIFHTYLYVKVGYLLNFFKAISILETVEMFGKYWSYTFNQI